jgi:hypothetical protein
MKSLDEFERELAVAIKTVKPRLEIGLAKVGELTQTMATHYIGHEMDGWAPLAASTIQDKINKGFGVPDPLLRTGKMRASIDMELDPVDLAVVIGSKDLVALWQEMGTSRGIPPRPFMGKAMHNSLPYAGDVFGTIAVSLLLGKPI